MAFQIASPLLDACVLSLLEHEDAYGYSLTQGIQEVIDVSDSTMYPVLRRLQKENYLETYDKPFQGRNRRYYKLTILGAQKLEIYRLEWKMYRMQIEKLLQLTETKSAKTGVTPTAKSDSESTGETVQQELQGKKAETKEVLQEEKPSSENRVSKGKGKTKKDLVIKKEAIQIKNMLEAEDAEHDDK